MQHYPRWVACPDGGTRLISSREQHEAHVGYPVSEDGTRKYPVPTIEEVRAAGYSADAAEKIVAREQAKSTDWNADFQAALVAPPAVEPIAVPVIDTSERFMKLYPCGCKAGPGPVNMPDYCGEHGKPEETAECLTIPFAEVEPEAVAPKKRGRPRKQEAEGVAAASVTDEAGIFSE